MALLLAVSVALGPSAPARAQAPPGPPSVPPAQDPVSQQVCVYALVILASNAPGAPPGARAVPPPGSPGGGPGQALTPTPDLTDPSGPPAPGGGCGQPVRLQPWVPRLQEVFGYSSYEPISAFETTMPLGMAQRFALPGGRELVIQPLAVRPPVVRIAVKVMRGAVAEIATVMDVPPRRPALIGGPPHGPGVLIIAIRSRIE